MASTVKSIIDEFCYRGNFPTSGSYFGQTTGNPAQYLALLRYIGDLLLSKGYDWPQLKRNFLFVTQTNVRNYPLPGDFYKVCESTPWDVQNQWPMRGPVSDYNMAIRQLSIVSLQTRKAYQFIGRTNSIIHPRLMSEYFGNGDLYFQIDPAGSDETDLLQLQYISKNWVLPPPWEAETAYDIGDLVNVNGIVYQCTNAGMSASVPNPPPTMANGIGYDGGTVWYSILADSWQSSTPYYAGQYAYASGTGQLYICTTPGTSGLVEPSSPTDDVEDGSVVWDYVPFTAWAPQTQYAYGDYVQTDDGIFVNLNNSPDGSMSVSGNLAPNWYFYQNSWRVLENNGDIEWKWIDSEYTIAADYDLVLLDKDLIIDGMNWAFLKARGLDYQDQKNIWEQQVVGSIGRFNGPTRINAADEFGDQFGAWPNCPAGSWDV
jgi:hypothetical protein